MAVYRSLAQLPADIGPTAITIGNFDGVHAGHRRILRRVAAVARERGLEPAALTFEPHPTRVVAPSRSPRLMTTPEQRCLLMAEEDVRHCLILPFTHEVARLSPEKFARRVIVEGLHARAVLVGDNFRFGHKQAGDTAILAELGRKYGFTTEVIPAIRMRGAVVSSSGIRRLIEAGEVARAGRLLERPYTVQGIVVPGEGIGTRFTVPTLNLAPETELAPALGVYITRTLESGGPREWPSVTNVGYRPTFGGRQLTIETFLLEPLEGATPLRIRLEFLRRLREERKFPEPEVLKQQILRDVARAHVYFRRLRRWRGSAVKACPEPQP